MKSLIIPLVLLIAIVGGGILEQNALHSKFDLFEAKLNAVQVKIEQGKAVPEDIDEILDWWQREKNIMHTFIPHTEIRDIDNWLVETRSFIRDGKSALALAKLSVVQDIAKSIPKTFEITPGNVF